MAESALRYERRRYGRMTYTWVYVTIDGVEHLLGDPWPCITPKRSEVEAELLNLATRLLVEALSKGQVTRDVKLKYRHGRHSVEITPTRDGDRFIYYGNLPSAIARAWAGEPPDAREPR